MIHRREFISDAARMAAGVALGAAGASRVRAEERMTMPPDGVAAVIPMPLQVVIDDVGWWSGEDGSERQEPYRTGIDRRHVPADYRAIVELGRALGIRPQAATVLCEWDKDNILRTLPRARGWERSGTTADGSAPGWRRRPTSSGRTRRTTS